MAYTDLILTALTIVTGVLAVVNYFNGRKKDNKKDGEREATLRSDLQYIKEVLIDVRRETKEINQLRDSSSDKIFQRSFFDHIVRNRDDYCEIYKYIFENPARWYYDKLYSEE